MKRFLGPLAAFLLIVQPLPQTAVSKATSSRATKLARVTEISGSKAGFIPVHVSKLVRIRNPLLGGNDVRIFGRGDFAGFALIPEPTNDSGTVLLGGRLPRSADGQTFLFDVGSDLPDSIHRKKIHVHKGDYRLYLLPGAGPTTVRLEIEGLTGALTVQPTHHVHYDAHLPQPQYETPGHNYYSAGGTEELNGRGLVFGTIWLTTPAHAITSADFCFWRNEPEEVVGYTPNCGSTPVTEPDTLWAYQGTTDLNAGVDRPFRMYYGRWQPFQSGLSKPGLKYGQSVIVESASAIESIGALNLWLSYD